jgi:hypothetical protein
MLGLIKRYKKYKADILAQKEKECHEEREKYEKDYIKQNISDDINISWQNIKVIFGKAKFVRRGATGFYPITFPEFDILWEFIRKYQMETEKVFAQGLLDNNSYVVAYCILGLGILKSPILQQLPKDVLHRNDIIEWRVASFMGRCTLKEFAKLESNSSMVIPK